MKTMKAKLILGLAVLLAASMLLSNPVPSGADFCDTTYGCRAVSGVGYAECVCDRRFGACSICCLDGIGCCWSGNYCTQ